MKKDEYVVVNITKLNLEKERLKKPIAHYDGIYVSDTQEARIELIEIIEYNSIALVPLIENAFDAARKLKTFNLEDIPLEVKLGYEVEKEVYIENLKIDL